MSCRPSLVLLPLALAAAFAVSSPIARAAHVAPAQAKRATARSGVASDGSTPVTMAPVGISIEYTTLAADLGAGPCPPPALVAELRRLGSPPLELAGASQDLTAPYGAVSGPLASWETGALYTLPASFWTQLHCLLAATGEPLTVGLNARTGALSWASQMVAEAQAAATSGVSFSVGNEPDLYQLPNYASLGHKRSLQEEPAAIGLYVRVSSYLRQAIGGAALVGPELASATHWRGQLPQVIAELHDAIVGVHLYPFSGCTDPRAATLRNLLSAYAGEAPRRLAWVVADANVAGAPAILSEANSVSCGGVPGVSNSPAAGVWAVRFVLSALKTGFREVRFHLSGGYYDPFAVLGGAVVRQPLESALAALNAWLPVGSSLRTLSGPKGVLVTAVSGGAHGARAIYDNESARTVRVELPASAPIAVAVLDARRAGLVTETLPVQRGRVKLPLAANSVAAVVG